MKPLITDDIHWYLTSQKHNSLLFDLVWKEAIQSVEMKAGQLGDAHVHTRMEVRPDV